ncbi:hypothetical protein JCM33374_g6016 [Metschnikowia sp. JCM 33374]|nr:hypothetical protein JCM33374_g6016 [Metschnikowia sp. JCM 33374]
MILPFRPSAPESSSSMSSASPSRSNRSSGSRPRSAKNEDAFDLSVFSDTLPPNTGPAGVTPITSGVGSSTNVNKNLSHVPCKFFKQGICQAGKSCPFSHNLDGSLSAEKLPCKYFQKGNCKFGLKCALAHILPDGTRVNSKNVSSHRRSHDRYERAQAHSGSTRSASFHSLQIVGNSKSPGAQLAQLSPLTHGTGDRFRDPFERSGVLNEDQGLTSSPPSFISPSTSAFLRDSNYFHSDGFGSQVGYTQEVSFGYPNSDWSYNYTSAMSSNSHNDRGGFLASRSISSSSIFLTSATSPSSSDSKMSGLAFQTQGQNVTTNRRSSSNHPLSSSSSPLLNYSTKLYEECAILDDDIEASSEDTYYEDYIPASLGNLIFTPQEKKRRDSRSQSGTLLVRPDIHSDSSVEKRPMFNAVSDGPLKVQGEVFLMD